MLCFLSRASSLSVLRVCLSQVVLLLKSSDRVADDISHGPAAHFSVALRRWVELRQEREFRCFVKDHKIVGEVPGKLLGISWSRVFKL